MSHEDAQRRASELTTVGAVTPSPATAQSAPAAIELLPDWMDASPAAMAARRRARYCQAKLDEYVFQAEGMYQAALGRSAVL